MLLVGEVWLEWVGHYILQRAVFCGVLEVVFDVVEAECTEVELDGGIVNKIEKRGTEVVESERGGREGLETVGCAELQEAVYACLVSAAGGWCNAECLEVVQSDSQRGVS